MEKAAAKTPFDWGADPSDRPLVDTDKIVINYTISQLTYDIVRDTDPKWFIDATKIDPNERLTPQQTAASRGLK